MNERQNARYIITDTIYIGDTEFVLGENQKSSAPYFAWLCKNENNYF